MIKIKESELRGVIREAILKEYGTLRDIEASTGGRGGYWNPKRNMDYTPTKKQKQFNAGNGKIDYSAIQIAGTIPTLCNQLKSVFPRCNEYQQTQLQKAIGKLEQLENYIKNAVNNANYQGQANYGLVAEGFWNGVRNFFGGGNNKEEEMQTIDFYSIINNVKKVYQLTGTITDQKVKMSLQGTLRFVKQILDTIRRG